MNMRPIMSTLLSFGVLMLLSGTNALRAVDAVAVKSMVGRLTVPTSRAAAMERLVKDADLLAAVKAELATSYADALATTTAKKPDAAREKLLTQLRELHGKLVAQKAIVGNKFPVADTKPAFLELVNIHQQYFQVAVALDAQVRAADKQVLGLREALRTVDPAATATEPAAAIYATIGDAELKAFAIANAATWTRAKQVYAFNQSTANPWIQPWQTEHARWTNGYRLIHTLDPAELHPKLIEAQQKHHDEMQALKYWDHTSPVEENKSWDKRIRNAGYEGSPGSENLAAGSGVGPNDASARAAVIMWFWDPHHNPLVNPGFNNIGPGAAAGMQGCSYGKNKTWQSEGLAVSEMDLGVLIVIEHETYAAAFGGPRPAAPGKKQGPKR